MHVPERRTEEWLRNIEPFWQSIRTGFTYVAKERDIRALMILGLGPLAFGQLYSNLMPIFAKYVLGGGAALQGALLAMVGVGSLAGALTVASMRRSYGYGLPVVIGAACFSALVFAFACSEWVWLSVILAAGIGITNVSYNTQNQTLLQVIAPHHLRGRVMSIRALERGIVPFATLLAGALASALGGPDALRIMSTLALAVIAIVVVSHPRILRLAVPLSGRAPTGRREWRSAEVDAPRPAPAPVREG